MATTIQIDEKTKELLDRLKVHFRQSYNELIGNMVQEKMKKKDVMEFAGAWKEIDDKEIDAMKESISKLRRSSTKELLKN